MEELGFWATNRPIKNRAKQSRAATRRKTVHAVVNVLSSSSAGGRGVEATVARFKWESSSWSVLFPSFQQRWTTTSTGCITDGFFSDDEDMTSHDDGSRCNLPTILGSLLSGRLQVYANPHTSSSAEHRSDPTITTSVYQHLPRGDVLTVQLVWDNPWDVRSCLQQVPRKSTTTSTCVWTHSPRIRDQF